MCEFQRFFALYIICTFYIVFNFLFIIGFRTGIIYKNWLMIIAFGLMLFLLDLFIPITFFCMLFYDNFIEAFENRKERIKNYRQMKYNRLISKENDQILHNKVQEKYLVILIKEYADLNQP